MADHLARWCFNDGLDGPAEARRSGSLPRPCPYGDSTPLTVLQLPPCQSTSLPSNPKSGFASLQVDAPHADEAPEPLIAQGPLTHSIHPACPPHHRTHDLLHLLRPPRASPPQSADAHLGQPAPMRSGLAHTTDTARDATHPRGCRPQSISSARAPRPATDPTERDRH